MHREYYRENGKDIKVGNVGDSDFYNASVTMHSSPGLDGR